MGKRDREIEPQPESEPAPPADLGHVANVVVGAAAWAAATHNRPARPSAAQRSRPGRAAETETAAIRPRRTRPGRCERAGEVGWLGMATVGLLRT